MVGLSYIITHGHIYDTTSLPGFIAILKGASVGLLIYTIQRDECEIVTLNSLINGKGVGSLLVNEIKKVALSSGCKRIWVITTNDNLHAMGFYQKCGFSLVAMHCDAVELSRRLKKEIPFIGQDGIPLRDEIELEMLL